MPGDVVIVGPDQPLPPAWDASVFIAPGPGSSPGSGLAGIVRLLRAGWASDGLLVVLAGWAAQRADVVVEWQPDEAAAGDGGPRSIYGAPAAAALPGLAGAVLERLDGGARRSGGERDVPLPVWRTDSFQAWYSAQTSAGNRLLEATPVWLFSIDPGQRLAFYWALHVRMQVAAENRIKSNEVVISRPDLSVMALYRRGRTLDDTTVVLIREFRSPAATPDGQVHELPGGSGSTGSSAIEQAISETTEETGLTVAAGRVRSYGSRQVAATVSAHRAHLFAAEISAAELARLRQEQPAAHGLAQDSERTWTEIRTFAEIRRERLVDWATLGMIAQAVLDGAAAGPTPPARSTT